MNCETCRPEVFPLLPETSSGPWDLDLRAEDMAPFCLEGCGGTMKGETNQ